MFVQKLVAWTAVLAFGAIPGRATEVFLTSSPSALLAQPGLGTFSNISFDGVLMGSYDSVSVGGVDFTTSGSLGLQVVSSLGGSWPAGNLLRRSSNGGEIDISLPGTVRAFGAAFGIVSGSLFTVTVQYSSGSASSHSFAISDTSVPVFLGFVTDAPITNLRFIADFGFSQIGMNNVMMADASGGGGDPPGDAPEASTMLLIGGGLVTLRLLRRRLRRTAPATP